MVNCPPSSSAMNGFGHSRRSVGWCSGEEQFLVALCVEASHAIRQRLMRMPAAPPHHGIEGPAATSFASAVDSALSRLVAATSSHQASAKTPAIRDFLQDLIELLLLDDKRGAAESLVAGPATRSRAILIFFNFALKNVKIRQWLARESVGALSATVCCLRASISEQLGPQNLIDVLRLVQVLTYEHHFVNERIERRSDAVGGWLENLLAFVVDEILRPLEPEWLGCVVAILRNLCVVGEHPAHSAAILDWLRRDEHRFKALSARLLQLLSHRSRLVVVSSLALVERLDDKLRSTVFAEQNIAQTFLCIFNVLGSSAAAGDDPQLMTLQIAGDLLRRLVVDKERKCLKPLASALPTLPFFVKSIQRVANQLSVFIGADPHKEEARKLLELLLEFCELDELRGSLCQTVIALEPTEHRLTTPVVALCRASIVLIGEEDENALGEKNSEKDMSIVVLQLLAHFFKEATENCSNGDARLTRLTPADFVPHLVEHIFKADKQKCSLLYALKLLEAMTNDEDTRGELLAELDATAFGRLFDRHMNTFVGQCPHIGSVAAAIPLQLMRLLAVLKDHSKAHKELYWRSLKDNRLLPCIAFSLSRSDEPNLIHDAFVLFTHCAQLPDFSIKTLSDETVRLSQASSRSHLHQIESTSQSAGLPLNGKNIDAVGGGQSDQILIVQALQNELEQERSRAAKEMLVIAEEKALLVEDAERERALQAVLRQRFDEMTRKFDTAAEALLQARGKADALQSDVQEKEGLVTKLEAVIGRLKTEKDQAIREAERAASERDEIKAAEQRLLEKCCRLEQMRLDIRQLVDGDADRDAALGNAEERKNEPKHPSFTAEPSTTNQPVPIFKPPVPAKRRAEK